MSSTEQKNLNEIYDIVAERLGIPVERVRIAVEHKYNEFAKNLRNLNHPAILDNGFGSFFLLPKKMRNTLNRMDAKGDTLAPRDLEVRELLREKLPIAEHFHKTFKK